MATDKEKKAVVTLCIGEKYCKLGDLTHPVIKAYADRIKADFLVINSPKIDLAVGHYEKFQIYDLLEVYKRILFVDTDVLITPHCPDVFEIVPEENFGAFVVDKYTNYHDNSLKIIQEELGDIGLEREYFNSGVMVISKHHREVFNTKNGLLKQWSLRSYREGDGTFLDQTLINYNVQRLGIPVYDIGYKFNHTTATKNSNSRFNSYVIHYPGKGHRRGKKIEQIKKDLFIIKHKPLALACSKITLLNQLLDRIF